MFAGDVAIMGDIVCGVWSVSQKQMERDEIAFEVEIDIVSVSRSVCGSE